MALAEQVFLNHDRVTCKIQTDSMLNNLPPAFSVSWIDWESGFRGSGLRVGDEIVGVNGVPVTRPEKPEQLQVALPKSVGQYAEHEAWAASGARDEDTVTLTVRRRQLNGVGWQTLDVKGRLRAERTYVNEAGRQLLGPGGPDYLANNGFAGSWQGWYEREIRPAFARVMQGHWPRRGLNTRVELQNLLDRHQARVE
ncbi:MAG: hypothetical protein FJ315_07125, partial [SAR202 cluster bacterium]|nr:hypothetical protein [SAR202 cluster bacterium]